MGADVAGLPPLLILFLGEMTGMDRVKQHWCLRNPPESRVLQDHREETENRWTSHLDDAAERLTAGRLHFFTRLPSRGSSFKKEFVGISHCNTYSSTSAETNAICGGLRCHGHMWTGADVNFSELKNCDVIEE
ncbi:unnamed protein product [Gadus morhua 'NCC']